MKEEFLHYIWQNKLFNQKFYLSDTGETIEIIDTGIPNSNSGPDFFNAKIKSENTVWAGNVEIHLKSSDWNIHKHHIDEKYDNVILHVVNQNDKRCFNSRKKQVSTIEIEFPKHVLENYNYLIQSKNWIACEKDINSIDPIHISLWMESLAIERLQLKTEHIDIILKSNNNNWEETFYLVLARSFGFGVNSDPFEQLAKSVPLKILGKHKSNIHDIEALLFGQSGILEMNEVKDEYVKKLTGDYLHFKNKYNLNPVRGFLWKFLRLRPVNFPTIRIAQFASLINKSTHLLSKIVESDNIVQIEKLFETATSEYWKTHYHFGKISKIKNKELGKESVKTIIINSVAPFLYLYGKNTGKEYLRESALAILCNLSVEKNSIVERWNALGIASNNSFDSQALIQMKKEYCDKKKCLQCNIGNIIITKANEKRF